MAPLSHILSSLACLQSILQVKCDQFYVNKGPGRDSHRTQIDEEHLTKSPDDLTFEIQYNILTELLYSYSVIA